MDQRVSRGRVGGLEPHGQGPQAALSGAWRVGRNQQATMSSKPAILADGVFIAYICKRVTVEAMQKSCSFQTTTVYKVWCSHHNKNTKLVIFIV